MDADKFKVEPTQIGPLLLTVGGFGLAGLLIVIGPTELDKQPFADTEILE